MERASRRRRGRSQVSRTSSSSSSVSLARAFFFFLVASALSRTKIACDRTRGRSSSSRKLNERAREEDDEVEIERRRRLPFDIFRFVAGSCPLAKASFRLLLPPMASFARALSGSRPGSFLGVAAREARPARSRRENRRCKRWGKERALPLFLHRPPSQREQGLCCALQDPHDSLSVLVSVSGRQEKRSRGSGIGASRGDKNRTA